MTCVLLCGLDDRITNVACLVGCKLRVATSSRVSVRECSLSQNYDKRFMSPVILFHHTLTPKYKSNKAPTLPSNFWQHDPPISVVTRKTFGRQQLLFSLINIRLKIFPVSDLCYQNISLNVYRNSFSD